MDRHVQNRGRALKRFNWVINAWFLIAGSAVAQTITLPEFLTQATSDHPLMREEEFSREIVSERRYGLLAARDWRLNANANVFHSKPIVTGSFSPTTIDRVDLGAQMQRSIWSSGGDLRLNWTTTATDQSIPSFSIPGDDGSIQAGVSTLYEHQVSLSYTQPLLQNYGGTLDRLEYDLAAYDVDVTELQATENRENFLLRLAGGFIDWVLLTEQVRIAEERLQLAEEEKQLTTEKRRANLVDKVDVLRSEDAVRLATQNLVLARSRARAKQGELAVLAEMPELREVQPEYDLYALRTLPTIEQASRVLRDTSRTLRVLATRARQLEERQDGFREREKINLNADFGVTLKGGDEEFFNSLEMTKPDLIVGVMLTHPFGARAARSDVMQAELALRQIEAQQQRVILELESQLHSLLIQLEDLEEILQLNQDQIESARTKTEEERRLYNQGRWRGPDLREREQRSRRSGSLGSIGFDVGRNPCFPPRSKERGFDTTGEKATARSGVSFIAITYTK